MAYYFMSEVSKGTYEPIQISNSKYFPYPQPKNKKTFSYKLPEIDAFTMMFDDETELRERLVEEGILSVTQFDKPLAIRCLYNNKYKKVPYDFLYQKDLEFIANPNKLIEKIVKRFYEKDFLLIKKIINRFSENRECSSTLPEVRAHLEASIREGNINKHFYDLDENNDLLLNRLLKQIIFESFNTKSGKTIYKNEIRYRNLHTLLALVNYYDKEEVKIEAPIFRDTKYEDVEKQAPVFEPTEKQEQPKREYEFAKVKRLSKKKYNLDGQTGFDV